MRENRNKNLHKYKRLLTPEEVEKLGYKNVNALAIDRARGKGPPFVRDGHRIFYPLIQLRKYLRARYVRTRG
jgi:hypothetical protein